MSFLCSNNNSNYYYIIIIVIIILDNYHNDVYNHKIGKLYSPTNCVNLDLKKKNAISNHADLVWGIVHIPTEQTVAELLFLILGMGNNYNLQTPLMRF